MVSKVDIEIALHRLLEPDKPLFCFLPLGFRLPLGPERVPWSILREVRAARVRARVARTNGKLKQPHLLLL